MIHHCHAQRLPGADEAGAVHVRPTLGDACRPADGKPAIWKAYRDAPDGPRAANRAYLTACAAARGVSSAEARGKKTSAIVYRAILKPAERVATS